MSAGSKAKGNNKGFEEFCERVGIFLFVVFQVLKEGFKQINWKCPVTIILLIVGYSSLFFILGYFYYFLEFLAQISPEVFTPFRLQKLSSYGNVLHGIFLMSLYWGLMLFVCGLIPYRQRKETEEALERLNIKAGLNCVPKVVSLKKEGKYKTKVTILSQGIGVDHYKAKIQDIESSFNQIVEGIRQGFEKKFVEITLTSKMLPKKLDYKDMSHVLDKPYSFIVGESLNGIITKSVTDFPGGHILAAGTSGGGKSNWFKATLLSLLKTSPHSELILFDFKGGVEFTPFKVFPNVSVEKDIKGALRKLEIVQREMDRRFSILEQKGKSDIVPKRDKLNHIFVAVDEASLLYGKVQRSDSDYENVMSARKITNDIAKRGRAARISLILATQKITKETIDTSIQENITGRICFRMNTLQGSLVVLGNKGAMELPEIPGRAIWQCGSTQTTVQAPLFNEKDIDIESQIAKYEYEEEGKKKFFDLLGYNNTYENEASNSYSIKNVISSQEVA